MRVNAFSDRQNLYYIPQSAFPNGGDDYNPRLLATLIAKRQSWYLVQKQFSSAIPDRTRYQIGAKMWNTQLFLMNHDECKTTERNSLYDDSGRDREIVMDKGIARDFIRLTLNQQIYVAMVF